MTRCAQCHFENPPQMKFCGECGRRLEPRCPACGAELVAGFKFCGQCGTRLSSAADPGETSPDRPASVAPDAPPSEAPGATPERRAGAPPGSPIAESPGAGSPAPGPPERAEPHAPAREGEIKTVTVVVCELGGRDSGEVDPEQLHNLLNDFFELSQAEIGRYGGVVNQFAGMGFLALFGAPVAYEDHARRGVLAALALRDRMAEKPREDTGGTRWQPRFGIDTGAVIVGGFGASVVGTALEAAQRMARLAGANEILVSGATADLVGPQAKLEAVETVSEVVAGAHRVLGPEIAPLIGTLVARGSLGPFVGRSRELAILEELRDRAIQGHGQVVGIAGGAGAGKSRLLHEFYHRTFPGRPVTYLRGQCQSFGAAVPYLPLIDMVRKSTRISGSDGPAEVTAKLRSGIERAGTGEDVLPVFLRLLGVDDGAEELLDLEPLALQNRTFTALRRTLLDASRRVLVVLELEDVHWIDNTSQAFVDSLVEVIGASRLLVLLTYRSGRQPGWLEKSYATQITMRPLSDAASRELLGELVPDAELGEPLVEEILLKGEGNPLFLEELGRSLLLHDGSAVSEGVPDSIQAILTARVDGLPREQKRLLKTASVLGPEFSLALLAEVRGDDVDTLRPLLHELGRREFLYPVPAEGEEIFSFTHALTQEVVYNSLLPQRRQALHRRVAQALEVIHADHLEDVYDRLVYHYPKAGEPDKTVHYLTRFASRAARDYAHAEAARILEAALAHAAQLPDSERDRRLVEILLQLAESLLPLARFPETLELCLRYAEHVERLGEPSLSAPYYFWLAHTYTYLGNQEECGRSAHLTIAAARQCGDEANEGKALYVLGREGFWSGRFSEGVESSLRAVVLLERSGAAWWQGQAHWVAGFNHYMLGDFDRGIEALERARGIGEALDDHRLDPSWSLGYFYASLGDTDRGIECCRRAREASRDPLNSAVATGFLGYAHLRSGDLGEATDTLGEAIELLRDSGMQQILGWFEVFLAEVRLALGDLDDAHRLAERGLERTREADFRYGTGLATHLLGRVAMERGRATEAKARLDAALDLFGDLGVPLDKGRGLLDLTRYARSVGDSEEAARYLAAAKALFQGLGLPNWSREFEAL